MVEELSSQFSESPFSADNTAKKFVQEIAPTSVETLAPYTSSEITDINYRSFEFSQGRQNQEDGGAHRRIIEYLVARYGDRVRLDELEGSRVPTLDKARKLTQSSGHREGVEESGLEDGVGRLIDDWFYALQEQASLAEKIPHIAASILKYSVYSDYDNLIVKGGRRRSREHETSSAHGPSRFLSQVAYYAISGHSTGMPEYDAMFSDVASALEGHSEDLIPITNDDGEILERRTVSSLLRETIGVYLDHYPDERKNLPARWLPNIDVGATV